MKPTPQIYPGATLLSRVVDYFLVMRRGLLALVLAFFSLAVSTNAVQAAAGTLSKIANNGSVLPDSAVLGSGVTDWACTRDNTTGLLWEVKTADGGLRDKGKRYTNYDDPTKAQKQGGSNPTQAEIDAANNSIGFLKAVNAATLCGQSDWRMPSVDELGGLVDTAYNPSINPTYFPNTPSSYFWSGSPYASYSSNAWGVYFDNGYAGSFYGGRYGSHAVRLVRGGQSFGSFALTISATGTGSGTLASNTGGINCASAAGTTSGTCSANYASGTAVTLTATPASGSSFTGWSGACSGTASTCSVTMDAAKNVSAAFTAATSTRYSKIANNGSVLPDSAVLGSGATDWGCTRDNATGLVWEVKTTSGLRSKDYLYTWYNSDSAINGGNAGTASGGSCNVSGRCDTEKFVQDVNAVGLCGGKDWRMPTFDELKNIIVLGSVPTINQPYFPNTMSLDTWSGSPNTSDSTFACYVYFGDGYAGCWGYRSAKLAVRLVRTGAPAGSLALTVSATGTGSGTLTSNSGSINCASAAGTTSGTCSANYASGTAVTLTATPASGSSFTGWGGACSGTASTCAVTMSAAKSVSAAFSKTSSVNNPPVLSQPSIGATRTQIGGSFVITDADGDAVKNLRLRLRDANGTVCRTGYFSGVYGQAVTPGTINFVTRDCISALDMTRPVTWWLEAWDVRGAGAAELSDTLVVANDVILPAGSSVRYDVAPDSLVVGEETTLKLSIVDSTGKVVSTFSGAGGITATGFDIETRDRRIVWFENGIASIEGFKAVTSGEGVITTTVLARVASADRAGQAQTAGASASYGAGDVQGIKPLMVLPKVSSKSLFKGTFRITIDGKSPLDDGEYALAEEGSTTWLPLVKAYADWLNIYNVRLNLWTKTTYRFRWRLSSSHPWVYTDKKYYWTEQDRYAQEEVSLKAFKRPILLLHGILGSTLQPKNDAYPTMPEMLCNFDKNLEQFVVPWERYGCGKLGFYEPLMGDYLGWDKMEENLTKMGFAVYRVAWDWRVGLDMAARNYLLPKIKEALYMRDPVSNTLVLKDPKYAKVDVIAHSMGGLVTRWLIQQIGTTEIDRFFMLGTPNGGSVNAYYLLGAANPLGLDAYLDDFLGSSFKPRVYTNSANNMSIRQAGSALVTDQHLEAEENEGQSITGYRKEFSDAAKRGVHLRKLAPGGKVLYPLDDGSISLWARHDKEYRQVNNAGDVEANRLRLLKNSNIHRLKCHWTTGLGLGNPAPGDSAFTWLYLSVKQPTITGATIKRLFDQSKGYSIDNLEAARSFIGSSWYLFFPVDATTTNTGDGTVPAEWAKTGLSGISECINTTAASKSHADLTNDQGALCAIFGDLLSARTDMGELLDSCKSKSSSTSITGDRTDVRQLSPDQMAPLSQSNATNIVGLKLSVWAPLAALFEGSGVKLGVDQTSGEIFLPTVDGVDYRAGSGTTGVSVAPVIAGEQRLTIYPAAEYENRLVRVEATASLNSTEKRVAGQFLMGTEAQILRFVVGADASLSLLGRPGRPKNPVIRFSENLQSGTLSWEAPVTGVPAKYRVYQREEGRLAFALLSELDGGVTSLSLTVPAVEAGSTAPAMEYLVIAVDAAGMSGFVSDMAATQVLGTPGDLVFTGVAAHISQWGVSSPVVVSGINVPVAVSISGGEYSVDGGDFRSDTSTIQPGQSVRVRGKAPASGTSEVTLAIGDGQYSFVVTPMPVPGAPSITSVLAGRGKATLTLTPASTGGEATAYAVSCSAQAFPSRSASGSVPTLTVSGLKGGVAYRCVATASNATGSSGASAAVDVTVLPGGGGANSAVFMLLLD